MVAEDPRPDTADARGKYLPARQRSGIALCLSGGGFRAALFHLGAVRRLNELGILANLAAISSVSGGSIMAAHLALNWERYTGSTEEFDKAASHLLDFIRLDVRNRILRRFPLGLL